MRNSSAELVGELTVHNAHSLECATQEYSPILNQPVLELLDVLDSLHLDINLLFDPGPSEHILPIDDDLILMRQLILDLFVKKFGLD